MEEDNVIIENVEFNEELYNKNIAENDFSNSLYVFSLFSDLSSK